ncbi:MAG TPA: peptidoglycan-binding domain-containing protein, partial [Polyangiaceae bacterium]|nr:peptidoglycan-binding domain-containing protein [Polyangiaceae bacterium]
HCAHFVNHVLGIEARLTCGQLLGRPGAAANIRVHETFAVCPSVGRFADRPAQACLAFVVHGSAVNLAAQQMSNVPKKHIGILCDGEIWHYSNGQRKVVRQTPEEFERHFSGAGFALFFGTFPSGARALAVPGTRKAADNAAAAAQLELGQLDNVDVATWQQFLIVRQLLSGPNIRRLLDGNFGPKTEEATEAFQISAGISSTGIVDAVTNRAAIERGFVPRVGATTRHALSRVTPALTVAAVDALQRLGSTSVFYTEEVLDVEGQRVVARLEPHKHNEGTQLRFWHRGITLYGFQDS